MDIEKLEKELGKISPKTDKLLLRLLFQNEMILAQQSTLIRTQAMILSAINPNKGTEDAIAKELSSHAEKTTQEKLNKKLASLIQENFDSKTE